MQAILDGEIRNAADYDEAAAGLLGMWFHSAWTFMLGIIDEGGGLERVMDVVADPRRLLHEYNRAARSLASDGDVYLFDDELAERLLRMGG